MHALRPIAAGEEITISYIGNESILQLGRERRLEALSRLGFNCSCLRCERGDGVDDALWREEPSAAAEVLRDADGDPILIWSPDVFLRCAARKRNRVPTLCAVEGRATEVSEVLVD